MFVEAAYFNKKNQLEYAETPQYKIQEIDTGYNNKYAYGVYTRKVKAGRGGKEGNNAFTYDIGDNLGLNEEIMDKIIEKSIDFSFFEEIAIKDSNFEDNLIDYLPKIIQSGNYKLAAKFVEYSNKRGGFGYNNLFYEVNLIFLLI